MLPHPILLAPTAYHKLVHPDGEIATARGAMAANTTMIVSSFSTVTIEDIARAVPGSPLWFQLYVQPDRGFTQSAGAARRSRRMSGAVPDRGYAGARRTQSRGAGRLRSCPTAMTRANLEGSQLRTASARTGRRKERSTAQCSSLASRGRTWSGCADSRRCQCCSRV